jgi:hypothetical protein
VQRRVVETRMCCADLCTSKHIASLPGGTENPRADRVVCCAPDQPLDP